MARPSVKVRDRGAKALFERLDKAKRNPAVTVGVHADEGSQTREGGITNVEVAAIHEFGATNAGIPSRSFIRDWFDESRSENQRAMRVIGQGVITGKVTPEQGLDRFGARMAGDVKKRIIAHIPPPNSKKTIARKGSSTPLIGKTTQLLNSITWKVDKGG
jgi:hypothetical protein